MPGMVVFTANAYGEEPPPAARPELAVEKGRALDGELGGDAGGVDVRLGQQVTLPGGRQEPADHPRLVLHLAEEGFLAGSRGRERRVAEAVRCPDERPRHQ